MLSECSSVHCTAYVQWGAGAVDLQIIDHFPDKTLSDQILNHGHHWILNGHIPFDGLKNISN